MRIETWKNSQLVDVRTVPDPPDPAKDYQTAATLADKLAVLAKILGVLPK